jgi:hypothetical protein
MLFAKLPQLALYVMIKWGTARVYIAWSACSQALKLSRPDSIPSARLHSADTDFDKKKCCWTGHPIDPSRVRSCQGSEFHPSGGGPRAVLNY